MKRLLPNMFNKPAASIKNSNMYMFLIVKFKKINKSYYRPNI